MACQFSFLKMTLHIVKTPPQNRGRHSRQRGVALGGGGESKTHRTAGGGAAVNVRSRQKEMRNPNWAANGIPTVVPGPKKSPSAPPASFNSFGPRIGLVELQSAFKQMCWTFPSSSGGMKGNAETSPT